MKIAIQSVSWEAISCPSKSGSNKHTQKSKPLCLLIIHILKSIANTCLHDSLWQLHRMSTPTRSWEMCHLKNWNKSHIFTPLDGRRREEEKRLKNNIDAGNLFKKLHSPCLETLKLGLSVERGVGRSHFKYHLYLYLFGACPWLTNEFSKN